MSRRCAPTVSSEPSSVDLPTLNLRLSPIPVMALELGSHPKPTQIADALVKDGLAVEGE